MCVLVVCSAAVARADDTPLADTHSDHDSDSETAGIRMRTERHTTGDPPLLHLDTDLGVASMAPGAQTDSDTTTLEFGRRTRIVAEGEWWKSSLAPKLFGPDIDEVSHGFRGGLELSYDLGPFSLGGNVAYGHVDSRYQRGTYRTTGITAFRTFRLSRWMLGWISLGLGKQEWLGTKPPPGEANQNTIMLSIGTTFR